MRKLPLVLAISSLVCNPGALFAEDAQNKDISELVSFLVSKDLLISSKDGQSVPLSYYTGNQEDIDKYFGDYICKPADTCSVVDSLYNDPYAILGRGLPPQQGGDLDMAQAQAQLERTDMKYGADIYDAATWQIALALAAKNHYLEAEQAKTLIGNQLQAIMNKDNRATDKQFKYGYQSSISDASKAFSFRMIATDFHNKDPFYKGRYQKELSWDYDPEELAQNDPDKHPAQFFEYVSTWSDWKPITGENAWAQLIGPLQAELLLNDGKVAANSPALINAMNSLGAFSAMQAGIGAFYYAPGGSQGNQGPIAQGEISVENNFSALGGLQILKKVLQNSEQTPQVTEALQQVDVMLNGGTTVNGYKTLGLLSFIYNGAYDQKHGIFYTHGTAPIPSSLSDWQPDTSDSAAAMAVDINTWGIAALGPETVDKWFGDGTSKAVWNKIREQGGYYQQGELWGVGYTLHNNSGDNPENIMSTEWTAGAINMVQSLIDYYSQKGEDISQLQADLTSMQQGIKHLRNDQYLAAGFDGATPKDNFVSLDSQSGQAYLYASKRFAIPFGWNANTLPSTTSNAWVIMNYFNYNPFQYGGKLSGENYDIPEKVDISGGAQEDGLPQAVTVNFNAGNLGQITQLSLSYNLDASQGNWIAAATVNGRTGTANLPAGAKALSIAFNNNGWAGACQVIPATMICKNADCSSVYTISTQWSADGKGACVLGD
ncbi:hypothetical protein B1207_13270 [Legionella quinlivanii]|uniref:Uncharacterized protein n=1 Tax=Legionella quinlivanii TaxID=45073 RepID=A0A364LGM2_9GAMM|nr:hypothetical protein [Legionella quinlivanii]RAP35336.1 hypothetical protein B1207_13270 [Legionella quinlivanii]